MTTGRKQFKFCRKCEQSKPIADYYVRATGRLEAWCKPCTIIDAGRRKALRREARLAEIAARPKPVPPIERECSRCTTVKPIAEFGKRDAKTWRRECKQCQAAYMADWYAEHRTEVSIKGKAYAERNRQQSRVRKLAKYGLTTGQYDAMYDRQDGRCLICGEHRERIGLGVASRSQVLCVDHHHGDGHVRGLLCTACNGGIGLLGDNPSRLAAAIKYLTAGEPNA